MIKKVLAASFWVSMGVLMGRLLGFAREATLASTFGVSSTTDIAVLTLTIPNILVNLLVAGGLSAALIPEFKSQNRVSSGVLFVQSSVLVLMISIIFVLILNVFSEWLVYLFAPGMEENVARIAQGTLRGVLWLIPLTVLAGVSTAFLQSQNRFAVPAMGTAIFNISVVIGLLVFVDTADGLVFLVIFIIAGGFLRWISQIWVLKDSYTVKGNFVDTLLTKHLLHRYWQGVTALGILTMYPVVYRSFASLQGEGELATVNFAYRLVELPLGVVITVLSVVLFPRLSEFYKKQDQESFSIVLRHGVFWSALLASSVAGVLAGASDVFTSLVYQRGEVTNGDIDEIALLVKFLAISLPFQAAIFMSIAGFNARKNTKTPMNLCLIGLMVLLPGIYLSIQFVGTVGGAVVVVLCYGLVSMMFLGKLGKNYLDSKFMLNLASLVVLVIYTNYGLINASKNLFDGSDLAVILSAMLLIVLVPFVISMFYKENRQYLSSYFLRKNH